ncbi:competence protein ComK [Bacillus tuaregi]|uniref:competence protein ComK n=1 Tax=Bacillus tuaregi TaxID=1816695 RepID=UPI0008F80B7B|nr:competence protein ComK [Bacillus tuaregi]
MITRRHYIISTKTQAFFPHFEHTLVLQDCEPFIVKQSSAKIMKASFHYFGINPIDAIQTARKILMKNGTIPIVLSAEQNLIFICCKALNHDGLVWLNNSHIQKVQPYRINKATVFLTNGYSIHVDSKADALQEQRRMAVNLGNSYINQSSRQEAKTKYYFYDHKNEIALALEDGQLKYIVKWNKKDDEDLDMVLD